MYAERASRSKAEPSGGETDCARRQFEQGPAELVLEPAHRLTHCWLGQVKALPSPSDVRLFGDREEALQLPQIHASSMHDIDWRTQSVTSAANGRSGQRAPASGTTLGCWGAAPECDRS